MRVVLEPRLFEEYQTADLFAFLWFGLRDRHRIVVEETDTESYQEFLKRLDPELREDWKSIINWGIELSV